MSYEELLEAEQAAWDLFIKLDDEDPDSLDTLAASMEWNRLFDHLQIFDTYRESY